MLAEGLLPALPEHLASVRLIRIHLQHIIRPMRILLKLIGFINPIGRIGPIQP